MNNNEDRCPVEHCYAPASACNLGEDDFRQCPHWHDAPNKPTDAEVLDGGGRLPWSTNSFGLVDLPFLTGCADPTIIGIVGPHNAGKTTLLTAVYLLLSRGRQLEGRSFAGSYTLGGWENLAHALRWKPGSGPSFPAHTASGTGRSPGLLHLSFRKNDGTLEDVLLTDAPGEWFERWAVNEHDPTAEGARWTANHAHAFMVLADCEALAGDDRGDARTTLLTLSQRLGTHAAERRVAVIWAKADERVDDGIRSACQTAFGRCFPHHQEYNVSVTAENSGDASAHDSILESLQWVLDRRWARQGEPFLAPAQRDDALLAYRGRGS